MIDFNNFLVKYYYFIEVTRMSNNVLGKWVLIHHKFNDSQWRSLLVQGQYLTHTVKQRCILHKGKDTWSGRRSLCHGQWFQWSQTYPLELPQNPGAQWLRSGWYHCSACYSCCCCCCCCCWCCFHLCCHGCCLSWCCHYCCYWSCCCCWGCYESCCLKWSL